LSLNYKTGIVVSGETAILPVMDEMSADGRNAAATTLFKKKGNVDGEND